MVLLIALAVMMAATIAVHLALPQAISGVVSKICRCHKCLTFWLVLVVLQLIGCNVIISAMLSLAMAYVSNWFCLLLIWLNDKYNELWQKQENKKM